MNEEELSRELLKAIRSGNQETVNGIANRMTKEQRERFLRQKLLPHLEARLAQPHQNDRM